MLVFGKTGQVAMELQRLGGVTTLGRGDADLSDPAACAAAIRRHAPKAVINAAAYTDVDRAEGEEALATTVNGDAPTEMARACLELGIPFVHISTDYVFDGGGDAPWRPSDQAVPQNAYGRGKLAGEIRIRDSGAVHAILRSGWVVSARGNNLVKTMLCLSDTRDELSIVDDQIGGPTPARDIAAACLTVAEQLKRDPTKSGTYHFSGAPDISWADFAIKIFCEAGRPVTVTPKPTRKYPTPAKRPQNSRMECRETEQTFAIPRPDWRVGLRDILNELECVR